MKKKQTIFLSILILIFTASCKDQKSYSQLQDEEQAEIQNYIQKNNYQVVSTLPNSDSWGTNIYYKTPSGMYFHLIKEGIKTDSVRNNITVGFRYIEYNIDKTIRLKNWEVRDYLEPVKLIYGTNTAISMYGTGLHEALGMMKYKEAEAKVIVPAFLNTSTYSENRDRLIPVVYHLKITVIK